MTALSPPQLCRLAQHLALRAREAAKLEADRIAGWL
jgi:hypothetical protein